MFNATASLKDIAYCEECVIRDTIEEMMLGFRVDSRKIRLVPGVSYA